MSDLLAARAQMAMSLGFHIIFASVGFAMLLLMVIFEGLWFQTGNAYLNMARRWAKGTAILFAVGAVSGTACAAIGMIAALRYRRFFVARTLRVLQVTLILFG